MNILFSSNVNIYCCYIILIIICLLFCINNNNNTTDYCPYSYKLLVTGSSTNHFHLLLLFLYRIYVVEDKICIVVWNLGLSDINDKVLHNAKRFNQKRTILIYIKKFNYNLYPKHFNISYNAGYYSWKPFVIWNTYIQYKRIMLWLDCGCFIHSKLDFIYSEINRHIIWSINSGTTIVQYTHIGLLKLLNVNKTIYNKTMCAGGIIGLYYPSKNTNLILSLWKACALIKNCISPIGANRGNHRQDQSILSILMAQYNFDCTNNLHIGFSTHFDKHYRNYNDTSFSKFLQYISSNKV